MGGTDLNLKKSWHPQLMVNQRKVYDAERAALAERKLTEARLEEIRKERQIEETQKQLEAAGGAKRIDRVDWMYAGPTDGSGGGDSYSSEAFLLGKRRVDTILRGDEARKQGDKKAATTADGAPTTAGLIVSARDTATKIRDDPLVAIKKQEQAAYEEMMKNPAKRRQLMLELGIKDESQDTKQQKEERSHRHHHRHRSSRKYRDHDERDDEDDRRYKRRRRSSSRERRRRSDSSESDRSKSPRRHDSGRRERSREKRREDDRRRDKDWSRSRTRKDASPRPGRDRTRRHDGDRRRDESGSRSRTRRDKSPQLQRRESAKSPLRRRSRSRDIQRRHSSKHISTNGNGDSNSGNARSNGQNVNHNDEEERARKLAAMQSSASELDAVREARLKAMADSEQAERDADSAARSKASKFGGSERQFRNGLHNSIGHESLADRLGRGRSGLQKVGDD